jgi:hypothetical protein
VPWAKIDDQFYDHPKVVAAGPVAIALFVCGLSYCNRHLTDGFISSAQIRRLLDVDAPENVADKLVSVGLWENVIGGYKVHDYLDYNMSSAQIKTEREANARRQDEWRTKRAASNIVSNGVTNGVSNTVPIPIPIPIPIPNSSGAQNAPAPTAQTTTRPKTPKQPREHDVLFDAIAEVCCVDSATAGSSIGNVRAALLKASQPFTVDEVRSFGVWWNSDNWRKEKGPPSLWQLKEKIGIVRNVNSNDNRLTPAEEAARRLVERANGNA